MPALFSTPGSNLKGDVKLKAKSGLSGGIRPIVYAHLSQNFVSLLTKVWTITYHCII